MMKASHVNADEVQFEQIANVIDIHIRPLLEIHGGGIDLISVDHRGAVQVKLNGACRACALKSVTYAVAVRQRLLQVPGVKTVYAEGINLSEQALKRVEVAYQGHSMMLSSGSNSVRQEHA